MSALGFRRETPGGVVRLLLPIRPLYSFAIFWFLQSSVFIVSSFSWHALSQLPTHDRPSWGRAPVIPVSTQLGFRTVPVSVTEDFNVYKMVINKMAHTRNTNN